MDQTVCAPPNGLRRLELLHSSLGLDYENNLFYVKAQSSEQTIHALGWFLRGWVRQPHFHYCSGL